MISPAIASAIACACFACTLAIAVYVSTRLPPAIDRAGMLLRGRGVPLAAAFTFLGRWYAIAGLALALCAVAILSHRPFVPVLVLLGSQIAAQGVVALVKTVVRRDRPARWLLRLESDSSFPSGHATTSIVFFVGAIVVIAGWHPGPATIALVSASLAIVALGIAWSRLVLEAHYVTDVAGGLLFGTGWLVATLPLFERFSASG